MNWFVRVLGNETTTLITKLIAIVSLLLSLGVWAKQYTLASCLADYNDRYAQSSGQRLIAAEEDRQALDVMVTAVVNAKVRGTAAAALRTYVETRAAADARRAKNPPPAPPSESCR